MPNIIFEAGLHSIPSILTKEQRLSGSQLYLIYIRVPIFS